MIVAVLLNVSENTSPSTMRSILALWTVPERESKPKRSVPHTKTFGKSGQIAFRRTGAAIITPTSSATSRMSQTPLVASIPKANPPKLAKLTLRFYVRSLSDPRQAQKSHQGPGWW
jgi:hypothetical protein